MTRIPYPDPAKLSPLQRRAFEDELKVGRMCAWMPDEVLTAMGGLGRMVLNNTILDPELRELALIRVGHLSNAAYEVHQHEQYARKIGVPEAKIAALKTGPSAAAFTEKERDVLRFVDEFVLQVRPSDATLAAVQRHLSIPELFTLMVCAGCYMTVSRILEVTGVELEEEGVVVKPETIDLDA